MGKEENFKSHTSEEFQKLFDKVVQKKYILLSEYKNSSINIKIKHIKCGNIFDIKPSLFLHKFKKNPNHDTCIYCCTHTHKTHDEFVSEVYELYGDEYIILSKYKNTHTKVHVHHNDMLCKGGINNMFEMEPNVLLHKHRCPFCKSSNGEKIIRDFLNMHKYVFKEHVRDLGCRSKKNYPLEFDFQIFMNDNSFILLEYDGRLHYEPWNIGKQHEEKLIQQKENDFIKDRFCLDNKYKLIRISYKDDITTKLKELLTPSTTIESIADINASE